MRFQSTSYIYDFINKNNYRKLFLPLHRTNIFATQDKLQAGFDGRPRRLNRAYVLALRQGGWPLESQASVHLEAAAGKEIVLEYKQHGMSDFLGLPQAL
jgi:hypothetical protein